jgi:hypothetical protein
MTPNEPQPSAASASRRRHSRSRLRTISARLWPEWRVEILAGLLLAVGAFLAVAHARIRAIASEWLQQGAQSVRAFSRGTMQWLIERVEGTTAIDLAAYALLGAGLLFVLLRIRWRLMTMPRFRGRECPACGSGLRRIHRRSLDRVVSVFVPVRRYRCRSRECRWQGLRVGRTPLE